ncbi:MAG: hypothetical protein JWM74_1260, partial [Myxococcaceae bacterium]|nr:hypothetical protein [Myxococcaceae bacterium]
MNIRPTLTVSDFMSSELLYLNEGSRLEMAKIPILELGVTAVPVLDEEHRPIGVLSLRDFARTDRRPQMSSPARSIRADAMLTEAASVLAEESLHHLVVVDAAGRAVGMLSALDVLRAVVGLPAATLRRPFASS